MIRRPPGSTLFPYTNALPICERRRAVAGAADRGGVGRHEAVEGIAEPPPRLVDAPEGVLLEQDRSEEHTSELQYANISYAVFCLKKKHVLICTHSGVRRSREV